MMNLSLRKKSFRGEVIKKVGDRITILIDRTVYSDKYERYEKRRSKLHAKLIGELKDKINVGDYVEIRECRPLSKLLKFVVTKKIRGKNESNSIKSN